MSVILYKRGIIKMNKLKQLRNATKKQRTTQGNLKLKGDRWILLPTHKQTISEFGIKMVFEND